MMVAIGMYIKKPLCQIQVQVCSRKPVPNTRVCKLVFQLVLYHIESIGYNRDMDKKLQEEADTILQIGQEDDHKAIPLVKEVMGQKDRKETEEAYVDMEKLKNAAKYTIKRYNVLLAELLVKRLSLLEWPSGWHYTVRPDDIGVVMVMQYQNRFFRAGFKPTGEELYDLNAVNTYAVRAENTIDRIMGRDDGHHHTAGAV